MGFPWGTCAVGNRVKGKDPVTITYNGIQGLVFVHAGWAMPNGNEIGTPWKPCSSAGHRAVACTGKNGMPGYNQYTGAELQPGKPGAHADHREQRVRRELPAAERVLRLTRQLPARRLLHHRPVEDPYH